MTVARGQITISAHQDGEYTLFQYAKNHSATLTPTADWSSVLPTCGDGEFLWLRSGVVIPPASEPASWSVAIRLTGDPGEQGAEALRLAQEANKAIASMNDDTILDLIEKQSIRTQWENISGVSGIAAPNMKSGSWSKHYYEAVALDLSVDKIANAYNVLKAYLSGIDLYTNSNTSNFDRAKMAIAFNAYYGAELTLVAEINKKQVDNIQIGGVNLLDNSHIEKTSDTEFLNYCNWTSIIDKHGLREYTLSFDIKASKLGRVNLYFDSGALRKYLMRPAQLLINATTDYTRHHITVTPYIDNPNSNITYFSFYGTYGTGIIPSVKNVKIELGNKATTWCPSIKDTQTSIEEVMQDKDRIAQLLGYADYAAMVAGGALGKTMIEDGFIRTDIIRANELIASNLRTALSGSRVEIIGDMKRLQAFDQNNIERVTVCGDPISSFAPTDTQKDYIKPLIHEVTIGPLNAVAKMNQQTKIYGLSTSKILCSFNLPNASITLPIFQWYIKANNRVSSSLEGLEGITSVASLSINIEKLNTATDQYEEYQCLLSEVIFTNVVVEKYFESKSVAFTGPSGAYRIITKFSADYLVTVLERPFPSLAVIASAELISRVSTSGSVVISHTKSPFSALYANGLLSYWGATRYFGALQLPADDFIRGVDGKHGFKLHNNSGFLVSTNANNGSLANWNLPMNCVLMGRVGASGSLISYRSCSGNLKATISRPETGRYDVTLTNSYGGASDYFSTADDFIVAIFPKSNTWAGVGLFEFSNKTKNKFRCSTLKHDLKVVDMEFVFYVIDIRNW